MPNNDYFIQCRVRELSDVDGVLNEIVSPFGAGTTIKTGGKGNKQLQFFGTAYGLYYWYLAQARSKGVLAKSLALQNLILIFNLLNNLLLGFSSN